MKKMPLEKVFTLIEPGPVTLITTFDGRKNNIMTLSWITVKEFTPEFVFITGPWNHSYHALVKSQECVISIPAVDLAETAVRIGTYSGADTDKFEKFGLTPVKADCVEAPLIKECFANIECRITDHIKKHNIFVLEGLAAWIDEKRKEKRTFHAVGDGTFVTDGRKINHRKLMISKLPEGV
ncbi:MAG: flavin reductase family protein [Endomicrobia bacterium]|nr:flavin reductase family protein [Endomicrobiia bacterium]